MGLNSSGNGRFYQTNASGKCCSSPNSGGVTCPVEDLGPHVWRLGSRDPFPPLDLFCDPPCILNGPIDEKRLLAPNPANSLG
jgi:hypothetical protein